MDKQAWGERKESAGSHLESNEKKLELSRGYVGHRLGGSEYAGAIRSRTGLRSQMGIME